MKKYKEPEISFISLKPAENVANPCWAYASNDKGKPYYYNVSGEGFLEFQITSASRNITRNIENLNGLNFMPLADICPRAEKCSQVSQVNFLIPRVDIDNTGYFTVKNIRIR